MFEICEIVLKTFFSLQATLSEGNTKFKNA
jgi:hypothetical protein